jgi:hypothetical protein
MVQIITDYGSIVLTLNRYNVVRIRGYRNREEKRRYLIEANQVVKDNIDYNRRYQVSLHPGVTPSAFLMSK